MAVGCHTAPLLLPTQGTLMGLACCCQTCQQESQGHQTLPLHSLGWLGEERGLDTPNPPS